MRLENEAFILKHRLVLWRIFRIQEMVESAAEGVGIRYE
jgi:hypothetical protein